MSSACAILVHMKKCSTCGIEKAESEFNKKAASKDGLQPKCRECHRADSRAIYHRAPEKYRANNREFHKRNPEYKSEYNRRYRALNIEDLKERDRVYREANIEARRANSRRWHRANAGTDTYRKYRREYMSDRMKNPRHRLDATMAVRIGESLRGMKAGRSWESLVGYTVDDLMAHLESLFLDGMSWENRSEWHIDHIIPKSWFDYDSPDCDEFRACWALSNLQPLWAVENMSKGNRRAG